MARLNIKAVCAISILLFCGVTSQLLQHDRMNLGQYNPETKHYEKQNVAETIAEDGTGRPHILGGDDHDKKPHGHQILGGDDHDKVAHNRPLLGRGDHDYRPHGPHMLGGDDHDRMPHGHHMLGGDDHDRMPHGHHMIGGDDHDYRTHGPQILGGDDHDRRPHGSQILGGDDHDKVPHNRPLLGRGDHDMKPHGTHMLGGDDHDKVPHNRPLLGRGDHDMKPHGTHMLGGDDHDKKPHVLHEPQLLGGDDHDKVPHNRPLLGQEDHDKKPHTNRVNSITQFSTFMHEHGKVYANNSEFQHRFSVFRRNLHRIRHFQRAEKGSATYGVTPFADLTEKEFKQMLGFKPELRRPSAYRRPVTDVPDVRLPVSFDWRDYNAVTPVKNQGMCGSCWAFSTTGNVEGQWAIQNEKLVSLSEQELVDCDTEDHGCEGGLPENAYEVIMKLGGLETEDEYPYNGHDGSCHMDKDKAQVYVNGSLELPQDEDQLAKWLYKNGPISIGINANPLQFYSGGVSHPLRVLCNPKELDHGMLIVGFGTHTTKYLRRKQPYWLIKNSWGTSWGEQGYYRVYRGDGTCGVNLMATSSIVP